MENEIIEKEKTELQQAKDVHYWTGCYSDLIDKVTGSTKTGLQAWFRGFIQSPEFEKLTSVEKSETFDSFQDLSFYLNQINDMEVKQK
jgi:hypothetical protein